MTVTRDETVPSGEPRIDGTRVGVRHVVAVALDAGWALRRSSLERSGLVSRP